MPSIGPSPATGRSWRRWVRAGALLPAVVATVLLGAPAYAASTVPPSAPPSSPSDDASCDTRPTSYPADGEPVPAEATCVLMTAADGSTVGEVWMWGDADGVRWYSFAAATVVGAGEGRVAMCGSTDPATAGLQYECSSNSAYLLFTVAGAFVDWPSAPAEALHFCQQTVFGTGPSAVVGNACATVSRAATDTLAGGEDGSDATPEATEPAAPPTTAEPEPTPGDQGGAGTGAPGVPTSDPGANPGGDETTAQPGDASESAHQPGPPEDDAAVGPEGASVGAPTAVGTGPAAAAGGSTDGAGASTPLASETIARVGGSSFPVTYVLGLAVALAIAGYLVLAAPALTAARRSRR